MDPAKENGQEQHEVAFGDKGEDCGYKEGCVLHHSSRDCFAPFGRSWRYTRRRTQQATQTYKKSQEAQRNHQHAFKRILPRHQKRYRGTVLGDFTGENGCRRRKSQQTVQKPERIQKQVQSIAMQERHGKQRKDKSNTPRKRL